MPRTTSDAVEEIVEVDASIPLTPFIEVASQVVTDNCTESDYTDEKLELIERWLAAHFYRIRDMAVASEKAGPVGQNYQYQLGLNFQVTMYGQQALLLDNAGNLASLQKAAESGGPSTVSVAWLGDEDE